MQHCADTAKINHGNCQGYTRPVSVCRRIIGSMNGASLEDRSSERRIRIGPYRPTGQILLQLLWKPMHSNEAKELTIVSQKGAKGSVAQPRRLFQHRVEHRGEI